MRARSLRDVVVLAVLAVGCAADPNPGQSARPTGCLERRVTVGGFGETEWAQHFASAIAGRLRDRDFTVVTEGGDATVAGLLTMTPVTRFRFGGLARGFGGRYDEGLAPTLSIRVTRGAEVLWERLYQSDRPKDLDDYAKDAAERIADACRRQWRS